MSSGFQKSRYYDGASQAGWGVSRREFLGSSALAALAACMPGYAVGGVAPRLLRTYHMGFILIYQDEAELDSPFYQNGKDVFKGKGILSENFETMKSAFQANFLYATLGRAQMKTSARTFYLRRTPDLFRADGELDLRVICEKFYRENADENDFLSIYSTFEVGGSMCHFQVRNVIEGIGRPIFESGGRYQSRRLLGVNCMRNVARNNDITRRNEGIINGSFGLLHETGHQWGVYVGDDFTSSDDAGRLEIRQQGIHLYKGVASPYGNSTPMKADRWVRNAGGSTWSRTFSLKARMQYHPIQLYLMGLLDESEYDKKFTVYNAGVIGRDFDPDHAVFHREFSIEQVIKRHGNRRELT